ncbi:(deoxy)nucleoside triphosphate pyrophosphohydrolase [Cohnella fermenti]|uniref:8-oxo-dGTP diphosphatase n=1 Tax=Cohnella fermenti TaxID=2565925 RepID=A0A4S4CAU5_9BACL|nr:(deoxy)nucleoside triphosphate pyrophosphohydrolase [Cohnella fermenti]THF84588.1 (deoxy)nucleoside triphosphate pyrophosphohydrolase [Cohnella fermenti]
MLAVAAAIIEDGEGRVLVARRKEGKSQAGLWEFPGGKLEPGESPADCLVRELKEEMGIDIAPYEPFGENEHEYGSVAIRLIAWRATWRPGPIRLADHDDYRWARPDELAALAWAPADIPFVRRLAGG